MLTACFLLWCLGQPTTPAERVSFTNDFRHSDRSERIVGYERNFVVFGAVEQTTAEDAVFAGALPVTVRLSNRFSFAGGAVVASTTVPHRGTHANFMARLQLDLTQRLSVTYWHWSNAHLGHHNPSVDSIGVTMRLRNR
jgi:Lipid A 3-O-deacylase (PagL)